MVTLIAMSVANSLAIAACGAERPPGVAQPGRVQVQRAGGGDAGRHVGEQERQPLELDDRPAELPALPGVARPPRRARPGPAPTAQAAMPSRPVSSAASAISKPCALGADQPVGRHPGAVEQRSARWSRRSAPILCSGGAADSPGVPASTSRQEMPRGPVVAGADHHGVEVGLAAVGDPGLGAVDHVRQSPSRRGAPACVSAAASEPDCGSDRQYAPSSSPPSMSGSQRVALLVGAERGQRVAGQRVHADARCRRSARRRPAPRAPAGRPRTAAPPPPYSSGYGRPSRPARPSVRKTSRGNRRLAPRARRRRVPARPRRARGRARAARRPPAVGSSALHPAGSADGRRGHVSAPPGRRARAGCRLSRSRAVVGDTRRCPRCARRAARRRRSPARSRTPCPAPAASSLPATMYGSSCVSSPMPWPVRWMNSSP